MVIAVTPGTGGQTVQAGNGTITLTAGQYNFGNAQDNQIAQWAREAGFGESSLPMAVAIAHAESGGNASAVNNANSNGSSDYGLMQINSVHSDLLSKFNKFDPVDNMRMAYQISNGGTNWKPWSTFNNGMVNQYLKTPTRVSGNLAVGGQVINVPTSVASNATSTLRANLVGTAMKYLGTPYVFGGNSLTQGIDCSGLVHEVYKMVGIATPRTADQDSHWSGAYGGNTQVNGSRTSVSNLRPGDLVCWQGGYRGANLVGHVAIYAGNGEIIEAPDVGINVRRRALRPNEKDVANGGHLIGIHLSLPGDR